MDDLLSTGANPQGQSPQGGQQPSQPQGQTPPAGQPIPPPAAQPMPVPPAQMPPPPAQQMYQQPAFSPAGGYQPMPAQGAPMGTPPAYDPMMYGAPQAGGMPPPGMPGSGGYAPYGTGTGAPAPGAGGPPPPPPPPPPGPPANFQLGALLAPVLKVKVPAHTLQFDEQYFLHMLAGSISLTKDEKARIIESIPKLKQSQVDELIRIFEEERRKFAELGQEHVPQLEKLAQQHYQDWTDIEMHQEQSSKADEDKKKAEELRKQLGLN